MQRAYDELVPSRTKVVRVFAFQSSAGPDGRRLCVVRRFGALRAARRRAAACSCSTTPRATARWAGAAKAAGTRPATKGLDGDYARSYRDFARGAGPALPRRAHGAGLRAAARPGRRRRRTPDQLRQRHGAAAARRRAEPADLARFGLGRQPTAAPSTERCKQLSGRRPASTSTTTTSRRRSSRWTRSCSRRWASIDKPAVVGEGAFLLGRRRRRGLGDAAAKGSRAHGRVASSGAFRGRCFGRTSLAGAPFPRSSTRAPQIRCSNRAAVLASAPWCQDLPGSPNR